MKPDDEILVRRCLEGDSVGFEGLLQRYEKPVFNVALRMVGDRDEARDVTQAVFLKVYRSLTSFDPGQRFFSWVYRIAVNESLNALGRRRVADPLDADALQSGGRDPAESAEASERCIAVRKALMGLAPDHRAVIVLRHFADCSYAEIARILDLPEKTVKSRLFTARQQLKQGLVARGGRTV
jgi:RNA polymerase sigma-70 factor (ECF subfamily)